MGNAADEAERQAKRVFQAAVAGALGRIGKLLDQHTVATASGPMTRCPDFEVALLAALDESEREREGVLAAVRLGFSLLALRDPGNSPIFGDKAKEAFWTELTKHDMRPHSRMVSDYCALISADPAGHA